MTKSGPQEGQSPSLLIDARIEEFGDWRGAMLGRLRTLVKEADPDDIDEDALKDLVRAAVTLNESKARR